MTRVGGSAKIAGQARLLPVAGVATGTAVALGPLLGLVVLAVGADMLASRQQQAKLDAIKEVVARLEEHELNRLVAGLDATEGVLENSMAALLDQLEVPEAVGLGSTAGRVKEIKALTLNRLRKWEKVAAGVAGKRGGVPYEDVEEALASVAIGGSRGFGAQVQLAYRALVLDSRTYIVAAAQATMARPQETVERFHSTIQRRLAENAEHFDRLSGVVWRLAGIRLTVGITRVDRRNRPAELQWQLVRLARALSEAPSPPPMFTADQRLVVEAVRRADGSVVMLAPRAEIAS